MKNPVIARPQAVAIHEVLDCRVAVLLAMIKFAPCDAADYRDDEETIAQYVTAALEDPNPEVFLAAVRDVARAGGHGATRQRRWRGT